MAFDWPGQLDHFAYELGHADAERKRDVVALVARDPSQEATELVLRTLEDANARVRISAAEALSPAQARAAIPVLRDLAIDPEAEVRAAAISAITRSGADDVMPQVLRALLDVDSRVRRAAATGLAAFPKQAALPALVERLEDSDPGTRIAAARSLGQLGEAAAAGPLAAAFRDGDSALKHEIARALGRIASAEGVTVLQEALRAEEDMDVQVACVIALAAIGGERAETALLDARTRVSGHVAVARVTALGALAGPSARSELIQLVTDPVLGEVAVMALSRIAVHERLTASAPAPITQAPSASPEGVEQPLVAQLVDHLSSFQTTTDGATARAVGRVFEQVGASLDVGESAPLLLDLFAQHRVPALARALGRVGGEAALIALLSALPEADEDLRPALLSALAQVLSEHPDSRAADPLLTALARAAPEEQARLAHLLALTGAERTVPALEQLLDSDLHEVKVTALVALGKLAAPSAAPALASQLRRGANPFVRATAAWALGRLLRRADLTELLQRVQDEDMDAVAVLHALETALIGRSPAELSPALRKALWSTLERLALSGSEAEAYAAIEVLAAYRPDGTLPLMGRILREPSDRRRVAAAMSLRNFDPQEARPLLRFLIRNAAPDIALGALLSVAEVGDQRDLSTVITLSERAHYPLPAVVPYVVGRLIERQVVPVRTAERALCRLVERGEAILRANAAAALAKAGAGPCQAGEGTPAAVLDLKRSEVERRALARWLMAAYAAGRMDRDDARSVQARCALEDPDATVRSICRGEPTAKLETTQPLLALSPLGRPLSDHLLGAQLADGSVFIAESSPVGFLRPPAPTEVIALVDPGLLPIITGASTRAAVPPQ